MLRYQLQYDENGDVIAPAFFVESAAVYAGEINNGIDRDNLPPNTIAVTEIGANVFTEIGDLSFNSDDAFALDSSTTTWQGGNGNGASGIAYASFTLPQDAIVSVYFSVSWFWNGAFSWNNGTNPAARDNEDIFDTVQFHITMDGEQGCLMGPFDDAPDYDGTFGVATFVVPQGAHVLRVEGLVVRRIAQSGLTDTICTNTCTVLTRNLCGIARFR
jgi:hypothetical protein